MSLSLGSLYGTGTTSVLRVGASRHGAPVGAAVSFTLGGTGGALRCSCYGCQASATATATGGTAPTTGGVQRNPTPPDYTDRIKRSTSSTVNALLAGGNRWFHTAGASGEVPSAVAKRSISYSFIESSAGLNAMDANGFQALNTTQRERVRDAFAALSDIVNVSFTEVASGGDIQFGSNNQANSAGYARYPNEGSQVFMANNQAGFDGAWEEGSYAWTTLLHETGHALGLKHPGNYNAGGGGTPGPYLPAGTDHRNNTLMSYRNAGNVTRIGYENGSFSKSVVNASTYQGYDIAALQYLYGASTTVQVGTYSFADGQALNKTLWNPNEGSRIDLSNQTGANVVDLRAGRRSSIGIVDPYGDMPFTKAQYGALTSGGRTIASILGRPTYTGQNNLLIAQGSRFTEATGGSGTDKLVANTIGGRVDGGGGDDELYWTGGDLQAAGGAGNDTLLLRRVAGARWTVASDGSSATLTRTNALTQQVTTLATVSMSGIESVRWWDGTAMRATGVALYTAPASPSVNLSV